MGTVLSQNKTIFFIQSISYMKILLNAKICRVNCMYSFSNKFILYKNVAWRLPLRITQAKNNAKVFCYCAPKLSPDLLSTLQPCYAAHLCVYINCFLVVPGVLNTTLHPLLFLLQYGRLEDKRKTGSFISAMSIILGLP